MLNHVREYIDESGEIHPVQPRMRLGQYTRNGMVFTQESKTQQHMKDETDINAIVAKYAKTGMITHVNRNQEAFADVSGIGDYHTALNTLNRATSLFEGLSSDVRLRFNNNPAELIAFLSDENNAEEAIKLGLRQPSRPKQAAPMARETPPAEGDTSSAAHGA